MIESYQIECEMVKNGTLHCAHSSRGLDNLKNRLRQHQARGTNVELISRAQTEEKIGTSAYHGALFYKDVGTIQPLAYLRGIANVAIKKGVEIFQNSPVSSLSYENKVWNITVGEKSITADAVIEATNAYSQGLDQLRRKGFTPIHYFQAATKPLSKDLLKVILPERQGCWDTALIMSSIRLDMAGRLIIGSVGSFNKPVANKVHSQWCHHKLKELFPQLGEIEFEHYWHGRIAYTANHLPKVVNFGPNAIKVFGYNGRGISPGTVFGRSAASYILTGDPNELPIQPVQSYSEHFTSLKSAYYEFGVTAVHGMETLL
jgi:glycine/D-amino acid oxidase-like deaminating enzyme